MFFLPLWAISKFMSLPRLNTLTSIRLRHFHFNDKIRITHDKIMTRLDQVAGFNLKASSGVANTSDCTT